HMLEEHVAILTAHPEAGLACSPSEYWYDWENNPAELKRNEIPPIAPGNQLYDPPQLLYRCYPLGPLGSPCPCSLVLRRGAYEGVGGFEETFNPQTRQLFEDMAFLAKIYLAYPVFVSRNCQSRYRQHALSMSSRVESDGSYEIERRYYFQWLMGYLVKQRVRDFATWKALIRRSLTSWLPFSRSITGRMKTPRERS
ncbi:MAG TPA: hypothetical protein VKR52_10630, partial [Terracidiphilus sp.]|nr:hypothetical protein [Terracidiphilus sp.]